MTPRPRLQRTLRITRLIFFPIPVAFFLSVGALLLLRPPWLYDHDDLPDPFFGLSIGFIYALAVIFLQVVAGLPSLLDLDSRPRNLRRYLATATFTSLILSFLLTGLIFPPPATTFPGQFAWNLLFLAPFLLLSYLLAFYLRKFLEPAAPSHP